MGEAEETPSVVGRRHRRRRKKKKVLPKKKRKKNVTKILREEKNRAEQRENESLSRGSSSLFSLFFFFNMAFSGGFRGVSAEQDPRFSDKQKKLLKTLKFSKDLLELKVDLRKVNWSIMRGWISRRTSELLGFEDDVLIGYIAEQLEGQEVRKSRG